MIIIGICFGQLSIGIETYRGEKSYERVRASATKKTVLFPPLWTCNVGSSDPGVAHAPQRTQCPPTDHQPGPVGGGGGERRVRCPHHLLHEQRCPGSVRAGHQRDGLPAATPARPPAPPGAPTNNRMYTESWYEQANLRRMDGSARVCTPGQLRPPGGGGGGGLSP